MSILVVADEFPWPPVNGSRLRVGAHLDALRTLGEVELFCVSDPAPRDDHAAADAAGLARWTQVDRAPLDRTTAATAAWAVARRPRELLWRDWSDARRRLQAWAAGPYELVWFTDPASYLALHDLVGGAVVVDYDDLESSKLAHRRALGRHRRDAPASAARRGVAAAADWVDERRWRRVEHAVAGEVGAVLVCSELDRRRLGEPNAAVVPNGYPAPADDAGGPRPSGGAPVLLFVGLLTYPPNRDAAAFLADEVLPIVRAAVPGAELRLVGRTSPEVEALAGRPGVTVVGPVDDVVPELRAATVAAVPVRFGGGTRVKILEAFAHHLPVVTTTVGGEGIEAEAGRHLLLGDDAPAFAAACVRLLQDGGLRDRVATEAAARFHERYRTERVQEQVAAVAGRVLAGQPVAP